MFCFVGKNCKAEDLRELEPQWPVPLPRGALTSLGRLLDSHRPQESRAGGPKLLCLEPGRTGKSREAFSLFSLASIGLLPQRSHELKDPRAAL